MRLAIEAVAEGRDDGVVSAGNTGALMAIAKFVLKMLPGIDRPAIASFFPTRRGESVMLDLGGHTLRGAGNGSAGVADFVSNGPLSGILVVGIKESANFNSAMVIVKAGVLVLFVLFGAMYINKANWSPFIPPSQEYSPNTPSPSRSQKKYSL